MNRCARRPRLALRHRFRLAVPFAVLWLVEPVAAEPLPPPSPFEARFVVLSPPLCRADSFQLVPFLDSLRVELVGRGLDCCTLVSPGNRLPTVALPRVKVEIVPCTADADRLQVSAHGPMDSRVVEREISLADVAPTARPRALALAVAELLRSLEQGAVGTAPEAVAVASHASLPSPTPTDGARPVSIHVEAEARALPAQKTVMWGGRARFTVHRRPLHADLDVGANYARAQSDLGVVLLRSASAGLGLGPRFATRSVIADLGLRAELGWAWIRGEPAFVDVKTGSGSEPIASIGLRLSLQAPAQVKIRPSITLESGGVVRGAKAQVNGQAVAGMTGYYLLAALGIAVSL